MPSGASAHRADFSPRFQWIAAGLFWSFVATLLGLQIWLLAQRSAESLELRRTLIWQTTFYLSWVPITVLVWRAVARRGLVDRRWWQALGWHVVVCLVVSVVQTTVVLGVVGTVDMLPEEPLLPFWTGQWRGRLYTQVVVYAGIAASGHAFVTWARWREQLDRTARLEGELAAATLSALRAQLHPHLLFNSLHAVASLVRESRNTEAVTLIADMSTLLRRVLDTDRVWHTVADELALVQTYLDVQRVRFEDRLQVAIDVDESARALVVPVLILQPLVENSLRHGLARKVGAGHLQVRVHRHGDRLRLEVADDGVPAETPEPGGVGLANLSARLSTLYRGSARLDAGPQPSGGFLVTIDLPAAPPQ